MNIDENMHAVEGEEDASAVQPFAEPEPMPAQIEEPIAVPVVEIAVPVIEEAQAAVAEPEPEPQPVVEMPAVKPKRSRPDLASYVVSGADKDPVFLSACVYMNKFNRKSLTVHHLQRRLVELGYGDAAGDKDGWYGELTELAVKGFQTANAFEATGRMDAKTFEAIFAGDNNVEIMPA